jgi:hypothetical protein
MFDRMKREVKGMTESKSGVLRTNKEETTHYLKRELNEEVKKVGLREDGKGKPFIVSLSPK